MSSPTKRLRDALALDAELAQVESKSEESSSPVEGKKTKRMGRKIAGHYTLVTIHVDIPTVKFQVYIQETCKMHQLEAKVAPEFFKDKKLDEVLKTILDQLDFDSSSQKLLLASTIPATWVAT